MDKEILLRWRRKGVEFWKKLEREKINNIFLSLIPAFPDQNENSKELVDCIRIADSIFINWDITIPAKYKEMRIEYWFTDGNKNYLIIEKEKNPIIIALFNGFCMDGSNIPSIFTMEWIVNEKKENKEIQREDVINIFQNLILRYADNNGISKRIVYIVPFVEKCYINWDNTAEINSLYYTTFDGEEGGIPISATHKNVWNKLKIICGLLPPE